MPLKTYPYFKVYFKVIMLIVKEGTHCKSTMMAIHLYRNRQCHPRRRVLTQKDKSAGSNTTETLASSRIPFAALDINLIHTASTERLSYHGARKLSKCDRVKKAREKHNK
jgi:hypothetical protein